CFLTPGIRRVAGYGLPGRFAKPCGRKAVRVRIPCLPLLFTPVVKRTSCLGPNEVFRVRLLVGVLTFVRRELPKVYSPSPGFGTRFLIPSGRLMSIFNFDFGPISFFARMS